MEEFDVEYRNAFGETCGEQVGNGADRRRPDVSKAKRSMLLVAVVLLMCEETRAGLPTINPVSVTTTTGPQTAAATYFGTYGVTYSGGYNVTGIANFNNSTYTMTAFDINGTKLASANVPGGARSTLMFDPLKIFHQENYGNQIMAAHFTITGGVWAYVTDTTYLSMYNSAVSYQFGMDYAQGTNYIYLGERATQPSPFSRLDISGGGSFLYNNAYCTPAIFTFTIWVVNSSLVIAVKWQGDYLLLDRTTLNAVHIFTPPTTSQASDVSVVNNLDSSNLLGTQIVIGAPNSTTLSSYDISNTGTTGEPSKLATSVALAASTYNYNYIINFGPYQYVGVFPMTPGTTFYLVNKPWLDLTQIYSVSQAPDCGSMISNAFFPNDVNGYFTYARFASPYNFQSYYLLFDHCAYYKTGAVCQWCISGYYLLINGASRSCVVTGTPLSAGFGFNVSNASLSAVACSDTNCINCAANYQICTVCNAAANYILMPVTSTCSLCGAGYFKNGTTPYTCYACNSNCATCQTIETTCTSCSGGNFVSNSNATCGPCNAGYYTSGVTCYICSSNCSTCTTTVATCTACAPGYFLSASICQPCNANCLTCSGTATTCTSCVGGKYVSTLNSTCGPCNTGYFVSGIYCTVCSPNCTTCTSAATTCTACASGFVLIASVCQPCNSNCLTCAGSQTTCTSCNGPNLLSSTNATCGTCGVGYYSSASTCYPCTAPCAACSTSATTCTACSSSYFLSSTSCLPCNGNCLTCSSSATTCTSCNGPNVLSSTNATCAACGSGFYVSSSTCYPCSSNCSTCTTAAATCTACSNGYFLSASTCQPCNANCLTCSGTATTCTTCNSGYALVVANSTCVVCAAGNFISGGTCTPCAAPCVTCSGTASTCTSCAPGSFVSGSTCASCNGNCLTCSGSAVTCTSCTGPSLLSSSNATCAACGSGFFSSGTTCYPCNANCLACAGTAVTCTACTGPSLLSSSNSTCGSCGAGYFTSGTTCFPCNSNCLTCSGSSTACTSCTAPSILSASNSTCGTCGAGYFVSGSSCIACASPCATCTTNSTNCLTCLPPLLMSASNNTCGTCGTGYFVSGAFCTPCSSSCISCTGAASNCTACPGNQTVSAANGSCGTCGTGYFSNGTYCFACATPCTACAGTSNHCTACDQQGGYVLNSNTGQCIAQASGAKPLALVSAVFDQTTGACEFRFNAAISFSQQPAVFALSVQDGVTSTVTACNASACPVALSPAASSSFTVNLNGLGSSVVNGRLSLKQLPGNVTAIASSTGGGTNFTAYPLVCEHVVLANGTLQGLFRAAQGVQAATGVASAVLSYAAVAVSPALAVVLNQFVSDVLFLSLLDGPFLAYPYIFLDLSFVQAYTPPNPFQHFVDAEQPCAAPSDVFAFQSVDCNFLGNFGNDLVSVAFTLVINIIISLMTSRLISRYNASLRELNRAEAARRQVPRCIRVAKWLGDNYGLRFFLISMEGSIKSVFLFGVVNLLAGPSSGVLTVGKAAAIVGIGYFAAYGLLIIDFIRRNGPALRREGEREQRTETHLRELTVPESSVMAGAYLGILAFVYEDFSVRLTFWGLWQPIIRMAITFLQAFVIVAAAGRGLPQLAAYALLEVAFLYALIKSNVKVSKWAQLLNVANSLVPILFTALKMLTFAPMSPRTMQFFFGGTMAVLLALFFVLNLGYAIIMFLILLYQLLKKLFTRPKNQVAVDSSSLGNSAIMEESLSQAQTTKTKTSSSSAVSGRFWKHKKLQEAGMQASNPRVVSDLIENASISRRHLELAEAAGVDQQQQQQHPMTMMKASKAEQRIITVHGSKLLSAHSKRHEPQSGMNLSRVAVLKFNKKIRQ